MTKHPVYIHPATPKKLITDFRRVDYKYHHLAELRSVNVYYIYQLIKYGKEPTNPNTRQALSLPRKPKSERKPRREPKPQPEYVKWWRSLTTESRHHIIERLHHYGKQAREEPL